MGGDTKTNVTELAQLLYNGIDLFRIGLLRIEDGFRVIEDDECLL